MLHDQTAISDGKLEVLESCNELIRTVLVDEQKMHRKYNFNSLIRHLIKIF